MDLSCILDVNTPGHMVAKHPITNLPIHRDGGKGEPLTLLVLSPESDKARKRRHSRQEAMRNRTEPMSPEEVERDTADFLANLLDGWNWMHYRGSDRTFSHEQAVEILLDPNMGWLREQIDLYAGKRAHFPGGGKG